MYFGAVPHGLAVPLTGVTVLTCVALTEKGGSKLCPGVSKKGQNWGGLFFNTPTHFFLI